MHSPSPLKPRTIHLTYSPKAFPFLPSFLHHDPPPLLLPLHRRSSFGLCSRVATHSAALKKRNSSNSSTLRCELEGKINGSPSPDFDPRFLDRQKALEAAMNDINSSFGKGSVTRLGSAGGALVETFPSGCLTLDFALGGGLPRGRIVEIYGPESSGKTTLALHAIAEVQACLLVFLKLQKLGGNAMLVDAEHAFDPAYSKALGVDVENLIVCQPDHGEMALEIADRMCRSGAVDLICVDSVSALTPRAEIEGEIGMQQMGLQARLMSQALRKMSGNASKAGCTLIFLNQIRYKIGVYYGNPEVTSGGIALKFFASVRLEIRSTGKIKSAKGDEEVGLRVRVRVQKSKVSRPYKQAEFEIIFGEGVSQQGCILDCAEMMGVVVKKGSWYSYEDQRLGQGRDRALQFLNENPKLLEEIEKKVRSMMVDGSVHSGFLPVSNVATSQDEIMLDEL
ncbi:DNA repair protein recA homolog 1, chloroplastic [Linum grandiflorum]